MGLNYCRNQTREVSAPTANLVTKMLALKFPSKFHFTLQIHEKTVTNKQLL